MAIRLNDAIRSVMADAGVVGYLGTAGILSVYAGTQPATGGGATTQGKIVEIAGISWNAATNGTALIAASKTGTCGTAGTAAWARLTDSSGTTYVVDGNCGTASTSNFVIDVALIAGDSVVTLTAATIVVPGS
jgi:hypothetical protein